MRYVIIRGGISEESYVEYLIRDAELDRTICIVYDHTDAMNICKAMNVLNVISGVLIFPEHLKGLGG